MKRSTIWARVDEPTEARVEEIARALGVSKSEATRRCVLAGLPALETGVSSATTEEERAAVLARTK